MNSGRKTIKIKLVTIVTLLWVVVTAFGSAVFLQRKTAENNMKISAEVLIGQLTAMLEHNKSDIEELTETLKEDYIVRARMAAHLLSNKENLTVLKLRRLSDLLHVDEIHLFNEKGVIYGGTITKYYGISFDSGEQTAFFKPMLEDKNLAMCQELTPNIKDEKPMMYAMAWREDKTGMVQVGVSPTRLLQAIENTKVENVIETLPKRAEMDLFVANQYTGEIICGTDNYYDNSNISEFGLSSSTLAREEGFSGVIKVDNVNRYCVVKNVGEYYIVVWQKQQATVNNIKSAIAIIVVLTVLVALTAVLIIYGVVNYFYKEDVIENLPDEKEMLLRCKKVTNDIMRQALNEDDSEKALEITMSELTRELGGNRCLLFSAGNVDKVAHFAFELTDKQGEEAFIIDEREIEEADWKWSTAGDDSAIIFNSDEVKTLSAFGYKKLVDLNIDNIVTMGLMKNDIELGFIAIANPDMERLGDAVSILQQMNKFIVSQLKLYTSDMQIKNK